MTDGIIGNGLQLHDGAHLQYHHIDERCLWQPDECTNGFTVSFWYKADFATTLTVLFSTTDNIPDSTGLQINMNNFQMGMKVNSLRKTTLVYAPYSDESSWHHFVGVWYSDTLRLYIDGITTPAFMFWDKDPPEGEQNHILYVGNDYQNQMYEGYLDELFFWREAKDTNFVRMLYELEPKIGNDFTCL